MLVAVLSGIPLLLFLPETYGRLQMDSQILQDTEPQPHLVGNGYVQSDATFQRVPTTGPVICYDEPINYGLSLSSSADSIGR